MEKFTPTTPITFPSITDYTIEWLQIDWSAKRIVIHVRANTGAEFGKEYNGVDAEAKMIALNKANLSVKSLQRRILELGIADGWLPAGSITGIPD